MDADGPDVVSSVTADTRVNLVVTVERSWWIEAPTTEPTKEDPMPIYRVSHNYRTDRIELSEGQLVQLDETAAEAINVDAGSATLVQLDESEAASLSERVAALDAIGGRVDLTPSSPLPRESAGGGPAMSTQDDGLLRR